MYVKELLCRTCSCPDSAQFYLQSHDGDSSMLFFMYPVYGLLLASFPAKSPPPKLSKPYPVNTPCGSTHLWLAPTRNELSSIACYDGDVIHYFIYDEKKNKLVRCIWEDTNVYDKVFILWEVREWYQKNSKKALQIYTDAQEVDLFIWMLSSIRYDC